MLISSSSQIHIFRRQKSLLLASNELFLMLTKTTNQSIQKIVNTMTYKVYARRHTHTHVYTPLSKPMSVSVLTCKVQ